MHRALFLIFVSLAATGAAQERPLPEPERFLAEVRARLETDEDRQRGYSYVETRERLKLDEAGRERRESVKVFESYPGLPGERRWRRMISENGVAVPEEVLAEKDRERREKAEAYLRLAASDPEAASTRGERDERLARRAAQIADAFDVFEMRMLGRDTLDGHRVIAFVLTPRRDAKPRTREGKMMKHMTAKAWVSEDDYELVRLEAEAHEDITIGLGLVARLHKGSRAEFHRRKINGEAWLPAHASYTASARLLLLKRFRQRETTSYSGYRKFTVATDAVYARPK